MSTSHRAHRSRRSLRPHWRVMTWVVVAYNGLMLAWVIAGASTASGQPTDCGALDAETCNTASDAGTAIGVAGLIMLWLVGSLILGVLWLVTRPSRHCPTCGRGVKRGLVACRRCGHSFRVGQVPA